MKYKYKQKTLSYLSLAKPKCFICSKPILITARGQQISYNVAADNNYYCVKCIETLEEIDCDWSLGIMAERPSNYE